LVSDHPRIARSLLKTMKADSKSLAELIRKQPPPSSERFWQQVEKATTSPRDKPRWRESQRKLSTADKVALLGQTILETLEFEKIKKHAKSL
jgi:hypothetical protein